jgi:regulatory protein
MPRVTALRPARPGRVLVELDGERWRTVPLEVAARVGLSIGFELTRPQLLALRRELRRAEAIEAGARSLTQRDRSEQGLRRSLARKGVRGPEREEAIAKLRDLGAIDDERFARCRAAGLSERGLGNAAIAFELEREGVEHALVGQVVAELEPETQRAARLAKKRGQTARTARWLAARGFGDESIEHALPGIAEIGPAELG